LNAELFQTASKTQVWPQEKNATKLDQCPSSNLKAIINIDMDTDTITSIDKMKEVPTLDREITKLRKIKQRLNQSFQHAMDQMVLKVLTVWLLIQRKSHSFKYKVMTRRKSSNIQDLTDLISQSFQSAQA
jgi:hypothetical protein